MQRSALVVSLTLALAVLGSASPAAATGPPRLHGDAVWPAGAKPAPVFRLRDERGRSISLTAERGRVVLLTFMYSRCRQLCPIEGRMLAAVERRLAPKTRPLLLVVSVDPDGDTPASIRRFVRRAGLAGVPLDWLAGSRSQLAPVWHAYRIEVRPGGDVAHSSALVLIDRRGYERSGYAIPFLPSFVAADLRMLAHEGRG
jgi:protein SCO1/2